MIKSSANPGELPPIEYVPPATWRPPQTVPGIQVEHIDAYWGLQWWAWYLPSADRAIVRFANERGLPWQRA